MANIYSNTINPSSDKDFLKKNEVSDSNPEEKSKKFIIDTEYFQEGYLVDPKKEDDMNFVLDRINYIKETVEKREDKVLHEVEIEGEIFLCEVNDEGVYITHPVWSLTGFGENLYEARKDMFNDMKIIASEYVNEYDSALTFEAINLKNFLLRVL
ncbi:MAG: hypothetical protein WD491_09720 [Balneolales bacterium]